MHGGGRTKEEDAEFREILKHVLPFIYLGCSVFILWERVYNQRFWPLVECWMATKMPTPSGLQPASGQRMRARVHGILSASGDDDVSWQYVDRTWRRKSGSIRSESAALSCRR